MGAAAGNGGRAGAYRRVLCGTLPAVSRSVVLRASHRQCRRSVCVRSECVLHHLTRVARPAKERAHPPQVQLEHHKHGRGAYLFTCTGVRPPGC